jgi:uncharacterized tellurite resistance protein B-like protein
MLEKESKLNDYEQKKLNFEQCLTSLLVHTATIDADVDDKEVELITKILEQQGVGPHDIEYAKSVEPIDAIKWVAAHPKHEIRKFIFERLMHLIHADKIIHKNEHRIIHTCASAWGISLD